MGADGKGFAGSEGKGLLLLKIYTMKVFAVTGTYHGSIIECKNEGEARRLFHKAWNGESIILVKNISSCNLDNL